MSIVKVVMKTSNAGDISPLMIRSIADKPVLVDRCARFSQPLAARYPWATVISSSESIVYPRAQAEGNENRV